MVAAWMLLLAWPVGLGQSHFLDVFLTCCLPVQSLLHTVHVYGTQTPVLGLVLALCLFRRAGTPPVSFATKHGMANNTG